MQFIKKLWVKLFGQWVLEAQGLCTIQMRSIFRGDFEEENYVRIYVHSRTGQLRAYRWDLDDGKTKLAPWVAQMLLDNAKERNLKKNVAHHRKSC